MSTAFVTSVFKSSNVKNVVGRTYSTQAAVATKLKRSHLTKGKAEVSTLGNGVVIATLENNNPISSIAILAKSGSRYESLDNKGVAHMIRLCAGLKTQNFDAFTLTRAPEQMGASLVCESGREYIFYGINMIRDNLKQGFAMLSDIGTKPVFPQWEVSDLNHLVRSDLANIEPATVLMDLLHKAAFRDSGLGNSLFIPEYRIPHKASSGLGNSLFLSDYRIGTVSQNELQDFFQKTHSSRRLAVVGLGVEHADLARLAKKLDLEPHEEISGSAIYGGGELRQESNSPLAYVAVAGPGASLGSADAASLAVAQSILSTTLGTKYGTNSSSKLTAALRSAGGSGSVYAFNINYSDAGLFGFSLMEEASRVKDVTKAVAKVIKNLKVSETDVKQAIVKAKSALQMGLESSENELRNMGIQALFTHQYLSPTDAAAALDKVTASSVQNALSSVLKGKPSMSVYGAVDKVPFVDEL